MQGESGVMMTRPMPLEPRPGKRPGKRPGRHRTSCAACRLARKKCEGGMPCDRYEPWIPSLTVSIRKRLDRIRAQSMFAENLLATIWHVQMRRNRRYLRINGEGWDSCVQEACAGS
jgi:hypothetical protein